MGSKYYLDSLDNRNLKYTYVWPVYESVQSSRNGFMTPTVDCSIATDSTEHTIGMLHTRNKYCMASSIQTLHADLA